jgi:mono/diheme cytochrome c family protein
MMKRELILVAGLIGVLGAAAGCSNSFQAPPTTTGAAVVTNGGQLYSNYCARCHGVNGEGTNKGNPVASTSEAITLRTLEQLTTVVKYHRSDLGLTFDQIANLAAYMKNDLK